MHHGGRGGGGLQRDAESRAFIAITVRSAIDLQKPGAASVFKAIRTLYKEARMCDQCSNIQTYKITTHNFVCCAEDEPMEEAAASGPTPQQITAIKAAIQNAQTLKEVEELEKALVTGNVPSQFQVSQTFRPFYMLTSNHNVPSRFLLPTLVFLIVKTADSISGSVRLPLMCIE